MNMRTVSLATTCATTVSHPTTPATTFSSPITPGTTVSPPIVYSGPSVNCSISPGPDDNDILPKNKKKKCKNTKG